MLRTHCKPRNQSRNQSETVYAQPRLEPGVTAFEEADAAPVPNTEVAVTVNVYCTPVVKPCIPRAASKHNRKSVSRTEIAIGLFAAVAVSPPGELVTV